MADEFLLQESITFGLIEFKKSLTNLVNIILECNIVS